MNYTPLPTEFTASESCLAIAETLISPDVVKQILTDHHCHEQRHRNLPDLLVFWLCITMSWFANWSILSVLCCLIQASDLFGELDDIQIPSPSAISQARYHLCEAGTHAIFDAAIATLQSAEIELALFANPSP